MSYLSKPRVYLDVNGTFQRDYEFMETQDRMEDLAVMIVADLVAEGRLVDVAERAVERWHGNFGMIELAKLMGQRSWWDDLQARAPVRKPDVL